MSYVEFKNICKRYEKQENLSVTDFNLEINKGEFIVFVGPSGCGKSTTLRMLAGLENITSGEVLIDGKVVNDVHPKDRDIAMVFQNYALYPHMTVGDNIRFGLKIKKISKNEIEEKVKWASDILGLNEYINRKPKDLSGGQRQRVALGRAIVRNPKVFLMDEPLSNLDAKLRVSMRNEITKLHKSLGATTIYVTHDQVEAMTMADRIVVMKDGFVQQVGTPMDLYSKPANVFVASFIGAPQMNLLHIEVKENKVEFENGISLEIPDGIVKKLNKEGKMIIGFRPEHISVDRLSLESFPGEVTKSVINGMEKMGHDNHIFTSIGTDEIILKINSQMQEEIGDEIEYRINLSKAHFFDADTKETII